MRWGMFISSFLGAIVGGHLTLWALLHFNLLLP
jgi:hypothetical protein